MCWLLSACTSHILESMRVLCPARQAFKCICYVHAVHARCDSLSMGCKDLLTWICDGTKGADVMKHHSRLHDNDAAAAKQGDQAAQKGSACCLVHKTVKRDMA